MNVIRIICVFLFAIAICAACSTASPTRNTSRSDEINLNGVKLTAEQERAQESLRLATKYNAIKYGVPFCALSMTTGNLAWLNESIALGLPPNSFRLPLSGMPPSKSHPPINVLISNAGVMPINLGFAGLQRILNPQEYLLVKDGLVVKSGRLKIEKWMLE